MKKMKLPKLPDRVPVKFQIMLAPDLTARLREYADLYAETYGVREEPADLVPFMLQAFLDSDAEFRRANKTKNGKSAPRGEREGTTSSSSTDRSQQQMKDLRPADRSSG